MMCTKKNANLFWRDDYSVKKYNKQIIWATINFSERKNENKNRHKKSKASADAEALLTPYENIPNPKVAHFLFNFCHRSLNIFLKS
jgi:hypothetical protein